LETKFADIIYCETCSIDASSINLARFTVSPSTISHITSRIAEDIIAWQNLPLEPVYLIVWLDGIAVGLRRDGYQGVLGMWLGKNESTLDISHHSLPLISE